MKQNFSLTIIIIIIIIFLEQLSSCVFLKSIFDLIENYHNNDELILQCEQFSSFHLVKKQGAQEYLIETIKKILSKQDIPSITLPENIQALSNVRH